MIDINLHHRCKFNTIDIGSISSSTIKLDSATNPNPWCKRIAGCCPVAVLTRSVDQFLVIRFWPRRLRDCIELNHEKRPNERLTKLLIRLPLPLQQSVVQIHSPLKTDRTEPADYDSLVKRHKIVNLGNFASSV